ncbi:PREDICTED: zinc finger Y-chromosomal protein 1-like [Dufourea novaeangliae]|uniref:Zinc finger X-linked protein ZXDB n=1 Tax=Dufourea novaeangliae TaxID=178035 RepID=A0A154P578_DUFNO|nr:PREDICTED: zinc finger Y-chromosomal protein 1-like [Dufourea novaeangliae]KZC06280.1 Zinc finger X-linked protein ZXDB [Dufourea novaeangliae]
MSRKGTPSACKSKQIPRIFRNRRGLCSVRGWPHSEVGVVSGSTIGYDESSLLAATPDEDKRKEANKKGKHKAREDEDEEETTTTTSTIRYPEKVWVIESSQETCDSVGSQTNVDPIGKTADVETVADIEKWLKTRTESVSSMDLDAIKSGVEEGVDRYLGEELQHAFLEKDPDGLSIDIDLSDKKLNLGYDPLLQELQSEKLLDACEKDGFILPEFQLDHLDPLALSPDDMMVAGEILPSTSAQPTLTVPNSDVDGICVETDQNSIMRKTMIPDDQEPHSKSAQAVIDNLHVMENVKKEDDIKSSKDNGLGDSATNLYMQDLSTDNEVHELPSEKLVDDSENAIIEQLKTKAKVKLEPRIIKRRRRISGTGEKKLDSEIKITGEDFIDTEDGVMAVVAISTDKISNMTQIVINTGTEEQIYQGRTSELIEATGNFPKLPKLDTSTAWNNTIEQNDNLNNHEMVISNALEELGITDDNLQPISITENGKVWVCPREDCCRQFSKLYALKGHLLAHYGVRPFKCDFEGCAWAFYSEFKLKRHKETHLKRKDYVCEVEGCNRRFTTIYNLWSHAKLHSRPNRIVCQVPDCQEKFQTKRALELHMKSHDQSHAPYVCKHEGCGKRYYSSNALTSHQRCHSYKEVDVKCSWPGCGKVFDKPCRLKAHIRSHTGCKPYLCTFQGCQWAFSSSSKLKRHQKKHTNERKFVCDVPSCGKAFMRSEHLKEHRLTHKEGRYFQCFLCNAKFSAKSSLYVHIKKHQIKEELEPNQRDVVVGGGQKRGKVKEPQCSRVNPVVKSKRKSIDLNVNTGFLNPSATENLEPNDNSLRNNNENQIKIEPVPPQDQSKTLYHCPVETCTRSYTTKATLRAHMLKVHGTPVEECDKSSNAVSASPVCNMDYILYTAPSVSEPTDQMIMVAPCDAVILSTSNDTDRSLPEPEPPPLNNILKTTEPSTNVTTHQQLSHQHVRKDQGSARTDLTFSDVSKLKSNGAVLDSIVGASDVVLGASDIEEGLLLTEELPSMYYQDDVVGTEYQVLLLDSVPPESTINLRGLE